MISQCQQVLTLLKQGPLTAKKAMAYGIFRLAARIRDLREMGYLITTQLIKINNRYGGISRFAVYRLADQAAVVTHG